MHAVNYTMAPPQLHSHDRLVRVRADAMATIVLEHAWTVQDGGVLEDEDSDACSAGITEWQGTWQGRVVSLGWDWRRLQDGAILPVECVAPRTNLMLIDDRGYDCHGRRDAALWQLVRQLRWEAEVALHA